MEVIKINSLSDNCIELRYADDLSRMYDMIQNEKDFIVQWEQGKTKYSEIIIATNIANKVKTGSMKLTANTN